MRSLVFSAFEGHPVEEVDQYLADFYDRDIAPLFRPEADAAMREHAAAGHVVVVISATFEPIILRAREHHPFENQVSTRMRVAPDGTYTREVEGLPVEGEQKLVALTDFADARFGAGNWEARRTPTETTIPTAPCSPPPRTPSPSTLTSRLRAPPASAVGRSSTGNEAGTPRPSRPAPAGRLFDGVDGQASTRQRSASIFDVSARSPMIVRPTPIE